MDIREFQNALTNIIKLYADYSLKDNSYINRTETALTPDQLCQIDRELHKLVMSYINQDGCEENKINALAKKLCVSLNLHSDRQDKQSPAIKWLESQLGEDNSGDYCFKYIQKIKSDLLEANNESWFNVFLAPSLEEYRKKLQKSTSFTQRYMWRQIIGMMEALQSYDKSNHDIAGKRFQDIALLFPLMSVSFSLGLFLPEMTTFLALAFTAAKSEEWLSKANRSKVLGLQINSFGASFMQFGIACIAKFAQYNIYALQSMLSNGSGLYKSITGRVQESSNPVPTDNSLQIIPFENPLSGRQFSSLSVKLIAKPLEEYINKQENQWGNSLRAGNKKSQLFKAALDEISDIDNRVSDEAEKMGEIGKPLSRLSSNYAITSSGKGAIQKLNQALFFHKLYDPNPQVSQLAYEDNEDIFIEL